MSWYTQYLSVFEKPFSKSHETAITEIRNKLAKLDCDEPLASVVVIAHNEESHLLACLWSLVDNVCNYPIEIIGIDNGSTDNTGKLMKAIGLKHFFEEKKGPGFARNCGLMHAKGKYHLCIDADTMYPPYYIQTIIENLQKPGIIAVSSFWSFVPDKTHSKFGLKMYEFLRNTHLRILFMKRPELAVRGMVFGFETKKGKEIGFKVNILRGEDGSMASELKKFGKIKLLTGRKTRAITAVSTLNTDGSLWNSFRIRFIKAFKGSKRYFTAQDKYEDKESNLIKRK